MPLLSACLPAWLDEWRKKRTRQKPRQLPSHREENDGGRERMPARLGERLALATDWERAAVAGAFARPMGNEGVTSKPRSGVVNDAFMHAETTGYFQRAHARAKHADDIRNDNDVLAGCDTHAARPFLPSVKMKSFGVTSPLVHSEMRRSLSGEGIRSPESQRRTASGDTARASATDLRERPCLAMNAANVMSAINNKSLLRASAKCCSRRKTQRAKIQHVRYV